MNRSFVGKTVVFVGVFQPSKFDKFFFIKNNIFKEQEILSNSIFNSDAVQLITDGISIIILINQTIITAIDINSDRIKNISLILLDAFKPAVTALGINFTWNLNPSKSLEEETKDLFLNNKNPMFSNFFNSPDAVYGAYVSKDFYNGRLKLEIKPQIVKLVNTQEPVTKFISFAFNFHFEIEEKENYNILLEAMENYNDFYQESGKIMSSYE